MAKLKDQLHTFISNSKRRRIYEREALALEASELISRLIEERGISKTELARLAGTSKSNITNLLSGARNMTMHTLADLAFVLGSRVELKPAALGANNSWHAVSEQDFEFYGAGHGLQGVYEISGDSQAGRVMAPIASWESENNPLAA